MLAHTSTYSNIPVCTSTCKHIPVHPVHTLISDTVMPWNPASGYITVHGSKMKYPKVLYPWIRRYLEIHEGTRPCTFMYQMMNLTHPMILLMSIRNLCLTAPPTPPSQSPPPASASSLRVPAHAQLRLISLPSRIQKRSLLISNFITCRMVCRSQTCL